MIGIIPPNNSLIIVVHAAPASPDILEEINEALKKPLVLHGGSGIPEKTIHACIRGGVSKINVNTEMSSHEGSMMLAQGVQRLTNEGIDKIFEGIVKLSKGTGVLNEKGSLLKEGFEKLTSGTYELVDGIEKYKRDGVDKITQKLFDTSEEVRKIIETKDEMLKMSEEKSTFTGKNENLKTSVKYVIKIGE